MHITIDRITHTHTKSGRVYKWKQQHSALLYSTYENCISDTTVLCLIENWQTNEKLFKF